MVKTMKGFLDISKYAGMREDLVQAGGGNTSEKLDESKMIIKASGIQLASVSGEEGYSIVNYRFVRQYMEELAKGKEMYPEKELLEKAVIEGRRPSIEMFLHAITERITLHTHSVAVNVLTSRKNGMEALREMFPDALIVGYATPGLCLARLYYQAYLRESNGGIKSFPVIFLKNHGLIVSGKTSAEVIRLTEEVNQKIEQKIGMDNSAYRLAYEIYQEFLSYDPYDDQIVVKVENKKVIDAYWEFKYSMWEHQLCPDCVVYCGKRPFVYTGPGNKNDLDSFVKLFGKPVVIQSGKDLFIRAASMRKAREIESVLAFSAQVAVFNKNYDMNLLTEEEQNFLLNWDAEKYRQGSA